MEEEWVMDIREHCYATGILFFFKQWGGVHKKRNGRLLQGRKWNEVPMCAVTAEPLVGVP